jgi:hypothetical protein
MHQHHSDVTNSRHPRALLTLHNEKRIVTAKKPAGTCVLHDEAAPGYRRRGAHTPAPVLREEPLHGTSTPSQSRQTYNPSTNSSPLL